MLIVFYIFCTLSFPRCIVLINMLFGIYVNEDIVFSVILILEEGVEFIF